MLQQLRATAPKSRAAAQIVIAKFYTKYIHMKTLVLLLLPALLWAQAQLGATEAQIRAEFPDVEFQIINFADTAFMNQKKLQTRILFAPNLFNCSVAYYFDLDGNCRLTAIKPFTQADLHALIEYYNKTYVIVSDTKWTLYTQGSIVVHQLNVNDDNEFYITVYESQK